jgi:Leucine-rich repeat (LRR) protein
MDAAAAIESLYQHLNTKPPMTDPGFWMGREFLTLMQIPFDPHVAAQIPPARSRAAHLSLADSRNRLPDYLLERLAWAADRPVHALQPAHWQKIESLDLSGSPVTTQALRRLHGVPRLAILNLRGCTHLTDTSGLATFRLLEHLIMEGCTGVRGKEAFKDIAELLSLQKLDLDDCTGLEETSFLAGLQQLLRLDLDGCTGLKDNGAFEGIRHLFNLEKLYLCGCTGFQNISVLQGLNKLQKLDLTNCTGLSDTEALKDAAFLPNLTELDVSGCTGLKSLESLAGKTQLKELDLSRCTGLQGEAAFQGLTKLPHLEILDLKGCTGLDEKPLRVLRQALPASCRILGPDGQLVERKN